MKKMCLNTAKFKVCIKVLEFFSFFAENKMKCYLKTGDMRLSVSKLLTVENLKGGLG